MPFQTSNVSRLRLQRSKCLTALNGWGVVVLVELELVVTWGKKTAEKKKILHEYPPGLTYPIPRVPLLKMIYLLPRWDMFFFPGRYPAKKKTGWTKILGTSGEIWPRMAICDVILSIQLFGHGGGWIQKFFSIISHGPNLGCRCGSCSFGGCSGRGGCGRRNRRRGCLCGRCDGDVDVMEDPTLITWTKTRFP